MPKLPSPVAVLSQELVDGPLSLASVWAFLTFVFPQASGMLPIVALLGPSLPPPRPAQAFWSLCLLTSPVLGHSHHFHHGTSQFLATGYTFHLLFQVQLTTGLMTALPSIPVKCLSSVWFPQQSFSGYNRSTSRRAEGKERW